MRTGWKLTAVAFLVVLVIVAYRLQITPVPMFGMKIGLVSETATVAPKALSPIAIWIGRVFWSAVALAILGVFAWVTQHVLRRPKEPDA
jgi:glucan phosphoethanolaminetransferase (alkaline phosphatase superfamily)